MTSEIRYDRQVRLWGDEGQSCIESANVCVLGSSALACEIIKNLVLAGINSVHIIDNAVITVPDLGSNFFLDNEIGHSRAEVALRSLMELNPSVKGSFDFRHIDDVLAENENFLLKFTVVIGCNLNIDTAVRINNLLFERNIPFVLARQTYGLIGFVQISVKEHTIINTHEENAPPDLRLDRPIPALEKFLQSINLEEMEYDVHSHTPYLILYMKALKLWREKYGQNDFPDNHEKRKTFEAVFMSLRIPHPKTESLEEENFFEGRVALVRSLRRTTIPERVKELLNHPKAKEPNCSCFWILVAALRRFAMTHEVLPVRGSLPDMISDSERYVHLTKIFRDKAKEDVKEVMGYACSIVEERNFPSDCIKYRDCEFFCKRAAFLGVQHGSSIMHQPKASLQALFSELQNTTFQTHSVTGVPIMPPSVWFVLLRAIDRFYCEKLRYPGSSGVPCVIDSFDLKARVVDLIEEAGIEDKEEMLKKIPLIAINEMCRYSASELHVIASLIGGIAAQEVIKLITGQYIPLDNIFIFDGHTQNSQTYRF
ncbi:unnamed protein product [Thelazia callipaeda]|uniref:NEDD8-activating enzyme E1 regulatory subunit n=1 Tax=Thelazia callipaeda TaxID=103827 RepID=A0A0N5DB28_THECL|nr:unnamed protein product [Thelazia callipaeda]